MDRLAFATTRTDVIRADLEELEAEITSWQNQIKGFLLRKQKLEAELRQPRGEE